MERELIGKTAKELTENLKSRYGISSTSQIYKRMNHLGLKPRKGNGEVWLEEKQLEELDKLDEHLKSGYRLDEYVVENREALVKAEPQIPEVKVEAIAAEAIIDNNDAWEQMNQAAQTKATGNLILQNLLAKQYLENPELLPEEMRQAIAATEVQACPKVLNPLEYAQEALRRSLVST
jgi:hypothetical protein